MRLCHTSEDSSVTVMEHLLATRSSVYQHYKKGFTVSQTGPGASKAERCPSQGPCIPVQGKWTILEGNISRKAGGSLFFCLRAKWAQIQVRTAVTLSSCTKSSKLSSVSHARAEWILTNCPCDCPSGGRELVGVDSVGILFWGGEKQGTENWDCCLLSLEPKKESKMGVNSWIQWVRSLMPLFFSFLLSLWSHEGDTWAC